ncbi:MAG: type II/IV secretion system ATPase subunit, partial [Candidatus Thermoplasmatota archaeon]|nr:type II/IV secretion system ATPase subunit [Candidatus Thermoplasmatota archaeon]
QYLYEVIEPELSDREEKILEFIEETIVDVLDVGLAELTESDAEEMVKDLTDQVIQDYSIEVDDNARTRLTYYTIRDFTGFGKLDVLMRDPMIEDISCDGAGIPIFLYHRKYESMESSVVFSPDQELDSFVIKLAQRSGKHISIADPLLDARLPDGSRLNATLSREVTAAGSTFTIRKFRDEPFTPPDLVRFGTQSPEMLAYFWMAMQHGASIIYAGGTASGKTTALNAIMLFIPPQMKIVSIEDTRELNLPHPNWIPGTTRAGFGSRDESGRRAGEIDMFELLKAALRQRPEYIAVGEVRGEEATVLFQAMATGHAAYGTMHADSVASVIHRLEGEPINIPRPLLEALDIVAIQMQTRIGGKRVRRTKELVEIVGLDPNTKELLTNEVFRWVPSEDEFDSSGISYVLERIQQENNLSKEELAEEMENRTLIIQWMVENGVRDYKAVAQVVQAYYNEPEETMARIQADLGLEAEQVGTSFAGTGPGHDLGALDDFDLGLSDEPQQPAPAQAEPELQEGAFDPPEPAAGPDELGDLADLDTNPFADEDLGEGLPSLEGPEHTPARQPAPSDAGAHEEMEELEEMEDLEELEELDEDLADTQGLEELDELDEDLEELDELDELDDFDELEELEEATSPDALEDHATGPQDADLTTGTPNRALADGDDEEET